jgi:PTS system mannose-specific IIA component
MISILVVSHGGLAKEFLDSAMRILGEEDTSIVPLCVEWTADSATAKEQIRKALRKAQEGGGGVLILTDLFGGTPTNLAMTFFQPGKVEILTGMNLPMLIKAILLRKEGTSLVAAVPILREKGQSAIVSVSEALDSGEGSQP